MGKDDKKKSAAKTKKPARRLSSLYAISGDQAARKNRSCPKCGPGMFLANHKNRLVCGKCQYVEMKEKS